MNELIQFKPQSPNTIRIDREGLDLILLEQLKELELYDLSKYDGIIIQTHLRRDAKAILSEIRSNQHSHISLKPVFLSSRIPGHARIEYLFDGLFVESALQSMAIRLKEINGRLADTKKEFPNIDYDTSIIQKTIKFCYSRNISLEPQRNRLSSIGYSFPFLSSMIHERDSVKIIHVMDRFAKVGYFEKHSIEQIQSCKQCSGGYLNYRETCPKCSSTDLSSEDLIHHFSCAHIAPISEFKNGDQMSCPKCEKNLRHIGIDYDKPSSVYTCNSCDHQFQNAQIKALCVDCGHDNELHQLKKYSINTYKLTSMGEHAAKHGMLEQQEQTKRYKPKFVSVSMFEMFRKQEIKRLAIAESNSWEASIKLNSEILKTFSTEQQDLIREEVQDIISEYLDKQDLITSSSPCWYRFLLFDKDEDTAEKITDTIKHNLTQLLNDGIGEEVDNMEVLLTSLHSR